MPRGVKGSGDYAASLQKIEEKIQKYSGHLAALREQRQEILAKQREIDMQELHEYMQEHGLTSRDILNQLVSEQRIAESSNGADTL